FLELLTSHFSFSMTRTGLAPFSSLFGREAVNLGNDQSTRVFFYRRKQMSKENITINNSDSRVMDPRSHESQELPNGRATLSKAAHSLVAVLLVAVALGAGFVGAKLGSRYQINASCCQIPPSHSLVVSTKEILGLTTFYSQSGQDKWVSEAVFPGVKNGF